LVAVECEVRRLLKLKSVSVVPQISIVIPTYNRAALLGQAIESVLAQVGIDLELIVVDDGSTDDTAAVVARHLPDARLRYIQRARQGRSHARNHGVNLARSQSIAFLDSDDRFLPGGLAEHWQVFSGSSAPGATIGGYELVDERGQRLGERRPWEEGDLTLAAWLFNCFGVPGSALVARSWFEQVGGFDPLCEFAEDWDLFLRLAHAGCPMAWVTANVCQYRQHPGNSTRTLELHCQGSLRALEKFFGRRDLRSTLRREKAHAMAWVHVNFARRAFLLGDIQRAQSHIRDAVGLYPRFAGRRKTELIEALLTAPPGAAVDSESLRSAIVSNLPPELRLTPGDLRRARARVEMAQFFRLAASDAPRAAHPHLRAGLRLDRRWLANRGVLAYLVRQRSH
jgi:glycosyltransferase involved in cell wall biosynthesis